MTQNDVVAPSDFRKRCTFEVEVDGKPGHVTPPHDVKMKELFEADNKEDDETVYVQTAVPFEYVSGATKGEFKYGICSCFDEKICCGALWWNLLCFRCIPVAQLLNRFGWDACAVPRTNQSRLQTFAILFALYTVSNISVYVESHFKNCQTSNISTEDDFSFMSSITKTNTSSTDDFFPSFPNTTNITICTDTSVTLFANIVFWLCFLYIIILFVRIRERFRRHYNIDGNFCCDFWTMLCCNCCAIVQMLRQTHEEREYPYTCCNCLTGLPDNAPEARNGYETCSVTMV